MLNNGKASIPKKSVSKRTSDKKGIQTKSKAIQKKKPPPPSAVFLLSSLLLVPIQYIIPMYTDKF